jgi:hypothetical protein
MISCQDLFFDKGRVWYCPKCLRDAIRLKNGGVIGGEKDAGTSDKSKD